MFAFPGSSEVKNPPVIQETQETQVQSLSQEIPWRKIWQPTPVFLLEKFNGQRSLEGCNPYDCKESDMTEYASNVCIRILFFNLSLWHLTGIDFSDDKLFLRKHF